MIPVRGCMAFHNSLFENICCKIYIMKLFLEHIFSNFELCKPYRRNCGTKIYKVIISQTPKIKKKERKYHDEEN